jgi:hydrogenase nickel incorporation protein HypA/HybF
MHELSIAVSIVEGALQEAEQRGVRITGVHIKLGALSGVVKDALLASYEMACCDTSLEGSHLLVEEVPVEIYCPKCRAQRPIRSMQLFCCRECGTPASEIVQGRELQIVALEIE